MKNDPFEEVLPLCKKTNVLIQEVFNNPDIVMGKLVQNIYTSKLQVRTWVKVSGSIRRAYPGSEFVVRI